MNKLPVYYPGSSVTLMFRIRDRRNASPVAVGNYHTEAVFFTRLLGRRILASDIDPQKVSITPANEYVLKISIPAEETVRLPLGDCAVKLTLTHKTDGSRLIVTQKIFTLKETLNDEHDTTNQQ